MIKDGTQYIIHKNKKYELIQAGYRWIQHKWSFIIAGIENPIDHEEEIFFLNTKMSVTFTERRDKTTNAGKHETETFIEAWIL